MESIKRDIEIERYDDCVRVTLLSEDAVAWATDNFSPNVAINSTIKLPGDGAETLDRMAQDGLTTV